MIFKSFNAGEGIFNNIENPLENRTIFFTHFRHIKFTYIQYNFLVTRLLPFVVACLVV